MQVHTFFCNQTDIGETDPPSWVEVFTQLPEPLQRAFPLLAFWGLSIDEVSELFCVPPTALANAFSSVPVVQDGA